MTEKDEEVTTFLVLQDREGGIALYLDDERIAGPKPMGTGRSLYEFRTGKKAVLDALAADHGLKDDEERAAYAALLARGAARRKMQRAADAYRANPTEATMGALILANNDEYVAKRAAFAVAERLARGEAK